MRPSHIFVTGASRSGTTLMARILAGGVEVADLRELHYLEQIVTGEEFRSSTEIAHREAERLVRQLLAGVRDGYFYSEPRSISDKQVAEVLAADSAWTYSSIYRATTSYAAHEEGKEIALDQTPRNLFYIEEIIEKLPQARIVCMVRDPRDVVLSQKGKWKRRMLGARIPLSEAIRSWSNYHPFVMAKLWCQAAGAAQRATVRSEVLVVRFEDLLEQPESTVRAICNHCGIAFSKAMLDVAKVGSSNRQDQTMSHGIDRGRKGAWTTGLSATEAEIVEKAAGPLLQQYGYSRSEQASSVFARVAWALALPAKMTLALALNFRRIRNLRAWASKRLKA